MSGCRTCRLGPNRVAETQSGEEAGRRGRTRVDEGGARRGGADQIGRDAWWRPIASGAGLAGLAGGLAAAVLWVSGAAACYKTGIRAAAGRSSGSVAAGERFYLRTAPFHFSSSEGAGGGRVGAWEWESEGGWIQGR
jgi:hypothetical protein